MTEIAEPPEDQGSEPEEGAGVPGEESGEEIESPFETETIRYSTGDEDRVLGVTLDGPKVGERSIDVFTLGGFLAQVDRVVRGLTAAARNLHIPARGAIPRPEDAAPWRTRALLFPSSARVEFVLGEGEAYRLGDDHAITSPTIEAIEELAKLFELDPESAIEELLGYDDRIGNDFSDLLELLAENQLRSVWEPPRRPAQEVPPDSARDRHTILKRETEPVRGVVAVTGFLFQLNAKKNFFQIEPAEGPIVRGTYTEDQVDELRDAWRRRVVAEVTRIEHRYPYAERPYNVEHELRRIVSKLESVDEA
jgi:hypothetical protein